MTEKRLGRITSARFGFCGYQDAEIGLALTFGGDGWGVGISIGFWAQRNEHSKWSFDDQSIGYAEAVRTLRDTLVAAKKSHLGELVGVPVEMEFDNRTLVGWRVLTEVL